MSFEKRDPSYLWDMNEAAREILEFMNGVTWEQFSKSKLLRCAVERELEIIGEAAKHI
jgi:uncharacterized protein with HEPN domain